MILIYTVHKSFCVSSSEDNCSHYLTLSKTTNFRLYQIKRVCRRQFQIWSKWQKVLQMGWKHCGKRRNCSLRAISPFPTVFSKDLHCRHVKTRACLGTGYIIFRLVKIQSHGKNHCLSFFNERNGTTSVFPMCLFLDFMLAASVLF